MTLIIIIVIVLILCAFIFCLSWRLFKFSCLRKKDTDEIEGAFAPYKDTVKKAQKWISQNTSETLEVISAEGLRLHAVLIPAKSPRGIVIAMHGYGSRYNIDFAPQAQFYHDMGYHLILPMQRSHYGSEGTYITFGVKERYDTKLWIYKAIELYGKDMDIYLAGISMGAATVMMTAQLSIPKNVKGIISDCGYTSPWDIICCVAKRDYNIPAFPLAYITNFFAKHIGKFDLKSASAKEAMAVTHLPVLFIHGTEDKFVPDYMTEENYKVCRNFKEKLLVSGAGHAQAYVVNPEAYEKAVKSFLEHCRQEKNRK